MPNVTGVATSPLDELQALIAPRTPLILVESNEESRLIQLACAASVKAGRGKGWAVFQWAVTEGLTRVDRAALAQRCDGFSGAEIEQAIVSAQYSARARSVAVNAQIVADELAATKPLSVVLGEKIAELREWATTRTVPADAAQ